MSEPLTPDQILEFYNNLLKEVLLKHNPAGLNTIDVLLKQFPGKEHQVYSQICKKCGVQPRDPPTPDDFVSGVPKKLPQPAASDGRVSLWLMENKYEKYAKQNQFATMSWEKFISISAKGRLIELGVIPKHAQPLLEDIRKAAGLGKDQQGTKSGNERKVDFEVGENCFTRVVMPDDSGGEKWLKARVTEVNEDTFDIFVYNSKAHGVPPEAVNVPRNMLKKSTEDVKVAVPNLAKQRSSKRPQFQHGDRIRVFGLRSHTTYNNLCGTVLIYVPSERRYQVRLDTNDVIAIKQRNVVAENANPKIAAAIEVGKKKLKKNGGTKEDEATLADLVRKLMKDNPNADPGKLADFATGYILAKKKLENSKDD